MYRYSLSLLLLTAIVGCGIHSTTASPVALHDPEQLTLLSIDGRDDDASGDRRRGHGVPEAVGEFHGYPVLGQVEITDPSMNRQLIAALRDGLTRHPETGAKCFWPRHGIRAVEKGSIIEYVICFECSRFDEFVEGNQRRHGLINGDVRPTFDAPLQQAGIPLAPK